MESLWVVLPGLACVAMMLVICLPMMMNRNNKGTGEASPSNEDVAALREEIALLRAERSLDGARERVDG